MLPPDNLDNIDDLFRQELDGHATPPAPDLWARLALPATEADPVDTTFQNGLRGHATPPRRELWERLEDEHLRPQPRRQRVVAWWQLSAAAVLLLLLGGALWSGGLWRAPRGSQVAHRSGSASPASGTTTAAQTASEAARTTTSQVPEEAASQRQTLATNQPAPAASKNKQEIFASQATAPHPSTSSTPIAHTTRPRRPATAPRASAGLQLQRSQPDVAASTLARHGGRKTPAGQSSSNSPQPTTLVPAPASFDTNAPALAVATPPIAPAASPEIIEVEVRRGGARPTLAPAVVAVADAAPVAPTRRRGLRLGGLLHQADRLVHGELAEATGLPETVTLQARLGGRLVSKTIQL
jgi:hypothetical protein